ncbi:MAG: ATP-binding cassette domain-containing protein, partial [Tissierellia bacterium]|nr:ATP-binding cassette domain-containing protein [Tissierellia bacterium]
WYKYEHKYIPLKGAIEFSNVNFSYEDKPILKDVSFYADAGTKIAFVGATGAGKTTIINLITRMYNIEKGTISIDGINIQEIKLRDLREGIASVLQETVLFSGTVRDNIRYGRENATDEEVVQAAKLANAHGFISTLPLGYETIISSEGSELSKGQRQLIAIARAALADPPILILDEATSSIDSRTEKLVQDGMDKLMEGRTVLVIAHRLSTIRNSAAIMVMENGEIVERGNHNSLMIKRGIYYKLQTGSIELR